MNFRLEDWNYDVVAKLIVIGGDAMSDADFRLLFQVNNLTGLLKLSRLARKGYQHGRLFLLYELD
jgi:hypothetical protein